jgi:hypothetical protein
MTVDNSIAEPMAWWIATGITTILIIGLGALLKIAYSSFTEAIQDLAKAVKDLVNITHEIKKHIAVQEEFNNYNGKEHDDMKYDLEDYHQRLNKAEIKINRVETIEENCPSNPFKK